MQTKPNFLASWLGCLLALAGAHAADYPIQPVPFTAVHVQDAFWSPRFETNRLTTVWYDFQKCEETGRIDNFAKAAGSMPGEFKGIPFDDSDVYKVIEGAAYILAMQADAKLDAYLDQVIAKIAAAQEPDGYLYTARKLFPPEKMPKMSGPQRWSNLGSSHELYNLGHLYEAAVAHFQATGKRSLLNVAIKSANFLDTVFGPGKLQEPPGHEEIEMGLVKLYRATGEARYLKLAQFFVELRGKEGTHKLRGDYQQDHLPVLQQTAAVGHAVRAGYFYSGVADVAAMTGERTYIEAIDRLWTDVVTTKMHLTGGIGARRHGEAFGDAYELPNRSAYLETCAAIANALWNHRMFLLHGEAKYADVLERVLYNGFLAGVSISGDRFFYPNPLEFDGHAKFNQGTNSRAPWFGCSCCPVNDVRFIPSIAGFIYATRGHELYVNLFIGNSAEVKLGETQVAMAQETSYPWDGKVTLKVNPKTPAKFALNVRIPGWAQGQPVPSDLYRQTQPPAERASLQVNGKAAPLVLAHGFARLEREWKAGDVIQLELPMPVSRVVAHEKVKDDLGRVAVERGPLVYCAEAADNGGRALNLVLPDDSKFAAQPEPKLLNGITVIKAKGQVAERNDDGQPVGKAAELTLIPYYAWAHRGMGEMAVWLPRTPESVGFPPVTVATRSKVSASFVHDGDSLQAVNDLVEPKKSGDHDIPRFTWWNHRGTEEWIQYNFDKPREVSKVAVFWFDDTGRGSCRVPQSWQLLCKQGEAWVPVEAAGAFGIAKDRYNEVAFKRVTTDGLKIVVKLQPQMSSGILEWKVE